MLIFIIILAHTLSFWLGYKFGFKVRKIKNNQKL